MRLSKLRMVPNVTTSSWWNRDENIGLLDQSRVLLLLLLINLQNEFSGVHTYFSEIFVSVPHSSFSFLNKTYL